MGKKDKNKKKGKGAEKTAMKTDKKLEQKQKKMLAKIGEANIEEIVAKLEAEEKRLQAVTETVCAPPTPRSNFSFVAHPEKEELILFGGEFYNGQKICIYNDLYFYNIPKNEWKLIKSPSGPTPRSGHQMVAVAADGGQLWLFGGEHASPSQLQFYHYKDLWVLRLNTKKWEKINAPNGPSPRSGHRMIALKKKLIVFGGFHDNNQSYRYFNDVHIFSLEDYGWQKFEITGSVLPPPRSGCCMGSTPDGRILIWGGYSKSQVKKDVDRGITHTDMYALVPDKSDPNGKFKWMTVKAGGYKPLPRSSVGYAISANGKAYCFGGVMDVEEDEDDLKGQLGNELYCLDLSTISWRLLEILKKSTSKKSETEKKTKDNESVLPSPLVTTDGIFTVTVGGSSSESHQTTSEKPAQLCNTPSPRMNARLVICKGNLYIYGGIHEEDSKQFTLSDFHSLDLHKLDEWKTLIPNSLDVHDYIHSDSEISSSDGEGSSCDLEIDEESESDSDMDTD